MLRKVFSEARSRCVNVHYDELKIASIGMTHLCIVTGKKKEKDRDRGREDENEQKFDLDALRDLFQKAKELVIQVLQYYITKHNEAFF